MEIAVKSIKKDLRGHFLVEYLAGDAKYPMADLKSESFGGVTGIQTLDLCLAKAAL